MKNSKNEILLTAFFIVFISLPPLIYPFIKNKMDLTNYENRPMTSINTVLDSNYKTFFTNFEDFFNDNLPFKNELQKLRAIIKYSVFTTPSSQKVIIGSNGWLFYNSGVDGITNEVGDYQKTTRFTDTEYEIIKENLISVQNKLKKNGKSFSLLIPSNKSTIYSEYMPKIYRRDNSTNINKTEALIDFLKKETSINIIYPKNSLIENKKYGATYYQYDTHWNDLGGFIGTMEIIESLENKKYDISNFRINNYKNNIGDLSIMNQTLFFANNYEPIVKNYHDDIIPQCTETQDVIECKNEQAEFDKTVLLIGDSFRTAMVNHLAKSYSHVVIVYVPFFNYSYIEKYNPQDVIYEVVERNTYQLFTIQDFFNKLN